ncbi:AMP-binding protein [Amycolatopsis sp. DSM 110486]|uniref:AMP-binding protein n=1 Tax=Amycolatopsis sp. DSM 110486 TaxID=2865832 RepID=UPI00210283C4|nr:AMP-binding protein [Amycolatopsis sp. DSM 110486]
MYPAPIARERPGARAYVMAPSGESLTYAELEARSNQVAHVLRERGIGPGGTLLLVLENRLEWPVLVAAGMRSGLYVTPVNWHLRSGELGPLLAEAVGDGASCAIVTSARCADVVAEALREVGKPALLLSVDPGGEPEFLGDAVAGLPEAPIDGELLGARVLYSGGSTGRPKAFRQQLLGVHPADAPARHAGLAAKLELAADTVFLSPAPNYHAAPFTFQLITLSLGGTVVCLDRFDAEGSLAAIAAHGVTHSQWVPTMLLRLLRLSPEARSRHDLSSHRVAFTSGAPCPPEVKTAVMDWWGPILHEYYGASEGYGHTYVGPHDALAHPGTVGKPLSGSVHVTDDGGREVPAGTVGKVWFAPGGSAYRNAGDAGADLCSVGDLGSLDEDGFLYLVGREGHTIISGGVNVYPTEVEDTLLTHPAVADAAVIGLPDPEFGEGVTAVVEPAGAVSGAELIEYCRERLAGFKAPRRVEFVVSLPRLPTGKLNKTLLRDRILSGDSGETGEGA